MKKTGTLNPRKVFFKKGACSHAMYHLINDDFNNALPAEEQASDMLAGGIAQRGHQCGMIWGGSLAIGSEAQKRFAVSDEAIAHSIYASKCMADSFEKRSSSLNCQDITQVDFKKNTDLIRFTIKTLSRGMLFSPCFNLMAKWTPEAREAAQKGLSEEISFTSPCLSCASEVIKLMVGAEEDALKVAGFAGGIGLSGQACGALAASLWYKNLLWQKANPDKKPSMFNNPDAQKTLDNFDKLCGGKMLCQEISKTKFNSLDEHSRFIQNGGCKDVLMVLADIPINKRD